MSSVFAQVTQFALEFIDGKAFSDIVTVIASVVSIYMTGATLISMNKFSNLNIMHI